MSVVVGCNVI